MKKLLSVILALSVAVVSFATAFGGVGASAESAEQIINISTISSNADARTHTTYSGRMNGMSFQDSTLVTYKGYQYATYWNNDRRLCVARRTFNTDTGVGGAWQEIVLNYQRELGKNWTDDAHNTPSLGIAGDGSMHLSFDMHDQQLNYMATAAGFCDDTSKWGAGAFTNYCGNHSLGNAGAIPKTNITNYGISYPRFISLVSGDMLFEFRQGTSSRSWSCMYRYSKTTHQWSRIGIYVNAIPGEYGYDASQQMFCAYINGVSSFMVNGKERLYITWCWRSSSSGASNHYIMAMHSDDGGFNWYNEKNQLVSTVDSNNVCNYTTTDKVLINKVMGNCGLMNQTTQWVDDYGIVHTLMQHNPNVNAQNGSYTQDIFYYHYWRNTDGTWKWESVKYDNGKDVPVPSTSFYRPQITSYGKNIYAMCNNLEVHKGTPNDDPSDGSVSGYTWSTVFQNYGFDQLVEPTFDRAAIKNGMLSIAMLAPEIDTRKSGSENSQYVCGQWMLIDINLKKANGRVSNKNIYQNGNLVGDDNIVFDADRSAIYPRNCLTDKEVDIAYTTAGGHSQGSGKNLSVQRNFGYGRHVLYFDGDFRAVAQKSSGFKFWVAGDSNAVLKVSQGGGVAMGFLCDDGFVYATTNGNTCNKDITAGGSWYEIDWKTSLNKYKALYGANRIPQFKTNNPNYNNGLPIGFNDSSLGSVSADSIKSKIIGVYIVFGNYNSLWNEGAIGSKVYIDDVQFTGYNSSIVVPTATTQPVQPATSSTTKPTQPSQSQTQPSQSKTQPSQSQTQPSQSQTQPTQPTQPTQAPQPASGVYMPVGQWNASNKGEWYVNGSNVILKATESSPEYTLYDYAYYTKSATVPADANAIQFTFKLNSIGNTNVPLEIYAGGNNTGIGKYSGTFINLGTGSEAVGKTVTYVYKFADFAGGANGSENRALTANQMRQFEPFEFRVRAKDMTTGLGSIEYSLSDITFVNTSGQPATQSTTQSTTQYIPPVSSSTTQSTTQYIPPVSSSTTQSTTQYIPPVTSSTTMPTTKPGTNVLVGDCNGDKKINGKDSLILKQFNAGLNPAGFVEDNADCNDDGKINGKDSLVLKQFNAGIVTYLPFKG